MVRTAATPAVPRSPTPQARPTAATVQMLAAVVRFPMPPLRCRIIPPPRKPTPMTTWDATRVMSARYVVVGRCWNSENPSVEITPKRAAPTSPSSLS